MLPDVLTQTHAHTFLRQFLVQLFQTIIDFLDCSCCAQSKHSCYKSVIIALRSIIHLNLKWRNCHQTLSLITKLKDKVSRNTLTRLWQHIPPLDSITSQALVLISSKHPQGTFLVGFLVPQSQTPVVWSPSTIRRVRALIHLQYHYICMWAALTWS